MGDSVKLERVRAVSSHQGTVRAAPVVHMVGAFSPEECDAIIALGSVMPRHEASSSYDPVSLRQLDMRQGSATWLASDERTSWVYDRVEEVVLQANAAHFGFDVTSIETLQLSAYGPGDYFGVHADFGFLHATRMISASVQLTASTDYEGGDLQFVAPQFKGNELPEAHWDTVLGSGDRRQGTVVLFPAYATHRVTPVTRGTRHSLVAWIRGRPHA